MGGVRSEGERWCNKGGRRGIENRFEGSRKSGRMKEVWKEGGIAGREGMKKGEGEDEVRDRKKERGKRRLERKNKEEERTKMKGKEEGM